MVVVGPTAVGKTRVSIDLAKHFHTEIVSADSRQFFREMPIGTAAPSAGELQLAKHHFVAQLSIKDDYSAGDYEVDALRCIDKIHQQNPVAVLTGGSGLYVKAVTHGLDEHPSDIDIRNQLIANFHDRGIEYLQNELQRLDPETHQRIDLYNHQRMIRALEVCVVSGRPYSSFLTRQAKPRPFQTIAIGLNLPRAALIQRIDQRVDHMIEQGLLAEARALYPLRHYNALQTVGYKELFEAFEGNCSETEAIEKIKVNTRRFAKRQMTWFKKNLDVRWFYPSDWSDILKHVELCMKSP